MQAYTYSKNTGVHRLKIALAMMLSLFMLSASSQNKDTTELRMTPQELKSMKASGPSAPGSSNLSAVQVIVVYGDPSKEGLYTILLKVAANTKIPAHLHPDDRVGNVVAGSWFFGYGDQFDEKKLKKLPAGSIYTEISGQNHFAMTGKEAVVVAITGYGPSGVTYVNLADDPLHKKE